MYISKKVAFVLALLFISFSFAQEKKDTKKEISLVDFIKDTQITKKDKDVFKLVWWIPKEYWGISMKGTAHESKELESEFLLMFDDYNLVVVLNTEISGFGAKKVATTSVQLKDSENNIYNPLKEEEISPKVDAILSIVKPSVSNVLGQFGEQLEFYLFPSRTKEGKLIAPIDKKGEFTIIINENDEFNYKLPLSSVVPKKVCPEGKKLLDGNWDYCPWHGKKLESQKK